MKMSLTKEQVIEAVVAHFNKLAYVNFKIKPEHVTLCVENDGDRFDPNYIAGGAVIDVDKAVEDHQKVQTGSKNQ